MPDITMAMRHNVLPGEGEVYQPLAWNGLGISNLSYFRHRQCLVWNWLGMLTLAPLGIGNARRASLRA